MTSQYERTQGKELTFLFKDINLIKTKKYGYVLYGIHVKNTVLKVEHELTENKDLLSVDKEYPAAPISAFAIILDNHRMVHVLNQKGSPTSSDLAKTFQSCINSYVRAISKGVPWDKKPMSKVRISNLPDSDALNKEFSSIKSIQRFQLGVVPLNPRPNTSHAIKIINNASKLSSELNADSTDIVVKKPKDLEKVKKVIKQTNDLATLQLNATTKSGQKKTIKQNNIKIQDELDLPEHNELFENIILALDGFNYKYFNIEGEMTSLIQEELDKWSKDNEGERS